MISLWRQILRTLTSTTGLTRVEIEGGSMEPTYKNGQKIWVRLFRSNLSGEQVIRIRGRVVLVEREEYPGIYLLKRLEKVHGDLIWVEGDNKDPLVAELQHDSRRFGWLSFENIRGVVLRG